MTLLELLLTLMIYNAVLLATGDKIQDNTQQRHRQKSAWIHKREKRNRRNRHGKYKGF